MQQPKAAGRLCRPRYVHVVLTAVALLPGLVLAATQFELGLIQQAVSQGFSWEQPQEWRKALSTRAPKLLLAKVWQPEGDREGTDPSSSSTTSSSPAEGATEGQLPITVLTTLTIERLGQLNLLCNSWPGPLVAAVWVPVVLPPNGKPIDMQYYAAQVAEYNKQQQDLAARASGHEGKTDHTSQAGNGRRRKKRRRPAEDEAGTDQLAVHLQLLHKEQQQLQEQLQQRLLEQQWEEQQQQAVTDGQQQEFAQQGRQDVGQAKWHTDMHLPGLPGFQDQEQWEQQREQWHQAAQQQPLQQQLLGNQDNAAAADQGQVQAQQKLEQQEAGDPAVPRQPQQPAQELILKQGDFIVITESPSPAVEEQEVQDQQAAVILDMPDEMQQQQQQEELLQPQALAASVGADQQALLLQQEKQMNDAGGMSALHIQQQHAGDLQPQQAGNAYMLGDLQQQQQPNTEQPRGTDAAAAVFQPHSSQQAMATPARGNAIGVLGGPVLQYHQEQEEQQQQLPSASSPIGDADGEAVQMLHQKQLPVAPQQPEMHADGTAGVLRQPSLPKHVQDNIADANTLQQQPGSQQHENVAKRFTRLLQQLVWARLPGRSLQQQEQQQQLQKQDEAAPEPQGGPLTAASLPDLADNQQDNIRHTGQAVQGQQQTATDQQQQQQQQQLQQELQQHHQQQDANADAGNGDEDMDEEQVGRGWDAYFGLDGAPPRAVARLAAAAEAVETLLLEMKQRARTRRSAAPAGQRADTGPSQQPAMPPQALPQDQEQRMQQQATELQQDWGQRMQQQATEEQQATELQQEGRALQMTRDPDQHVFDYEMLDYADPRADMWGGAAPVTNEDLANAGMASSAHAQPPHGALVPGRQSSGLANSADVQLPGSALGPDQQRGDGEVDADEVAKIIDSDEDIDDDGDVGSSTAANVQGADGQQAISAAGASAPLANAPAPPSGNAQQGAAISSKSGSDMRPVLRMKPVINARNQIMWVPVATLASTSAMQADAAEAASGPGKQGNEQTAPAPDTTGPPVSNDSTKQQLAGHNSARVAAADDRLDRVEVLAGDVAHTTASRELPAAAAADSAHASDSTGQEQQQATASPSYTTVAKEDAGSKQGPPSLAAADAAAATSGKHPQAAHGPAAPTASPVAKGQQLSSTTPDAQVQQTSSKATDVQVQRHSSSASGTLEQKLDITAFANQEQLLNSTAAGTQKPQSPVPPATDNHASIAGPAHISDLGDLQSASAPSPSSIQGSMQQQTSMATASEQAAAASPGAGAQGTTHSGVEGAQLTDAQPAAAQPAATQVAGAPDDRIEEQGVLGLNLAGDAPRALTDIPDDTVPSNLRSSSFVSYSSYRDTQKTRFTHQGTTSSNEGRFGKGRQQQPTCQLTIMLFIQVFADPVAPMFLFPINSLRNYAGLMAKTPLVAMVDVDLIFNAGFAASLLSDPQRSADLVADAASGSLLIPPAFEALRCHTARCKDGAATGLVAAHINKPQLHDLFNRGWLDTFHCKKGTHWMVDYAHWFNSSSAYEVRYAHAAEPWYIGHRSLLPFYDTRFKGFGFNKQLQVMYAAGNMRMRLRVLPDAWLVHVPHARTTVAHAFRTKAYRKASPTEAMANAEQHLDWRNNWEQAIDSHTGQGSAKDLQARQLVPQHSTADYDPYKTQITRSKQVSQRGRMRADGGHSSIFDKDQWLMSYLAERARTQLQQAAADDAALPIRQQWFPPPMDDTETEDEEAEAQINELGLTTALARYSVDSADATMAMADRLADLGCTTEDTASVTWSSVPTWACTSAHDQLAWHGSSSYGRHRSWLGHVWAGLMHLLIQGSSLGGDLDVLYPPPRWHFAASYASIVPHGRLLQHAQSTSSDIWLSQQANQQSQQQAGAMIGPVVPSAGRPVTSLQDHLSGPGRSVATVPATPEARSVVKGWDKDTAVGVRAHPVHEAAVGQKLAGRKSRRRRKRRKGDKLGKRQDRSRAQIGGTKSSRGLLQQAASIPMDDALAHHSDVAAKPHGVHMESGSQAAPWPQRQPGLQQQHDSMSVGAAGVHRHDSNGGSMHLSTQDVAALQPRSMLSEATGSHRKGARRLLQDSNNQATASAAQQLDTTAGDTVNVDAEDRDLQAHHLRVGRANADQQDGPEDPQLTEPEAGAPVAKTTTAPEQDMDSLLASDLNMDLHGDEDAVGSADEADGKAGASDARPVSNATAGTDEEAGPRSLLQGLITADEHTVYERLRWLYAHMFHEKWRPTGNFLLKSEGLRLPADEHPVVDAAMLHLVRVLPWWTEYSRRWNLGQPSSVTPPYLDPPALAPWPLALVKTMRARMEMCSPHDMAQPAWQKG